jgi:hypothetical protein
MAERTRLLVLDLLETYARERTSTFVWSASTTVRSELHAQHERQRQPWERLARAVRARTKRSCAPWSRSASRCRKCAPVTSTVSRRQFSVFDAKP